MGHYWRKKLSWGLLCVVLLGSGCRGFTGVKHEPLAPLPVLGSYSASPTTVRGVGAFPEDALNRRLGLESSGEEPNITLATALDQAGLDNPTVNLAAERVRESEAGQLRAQALVLPNFSFGANVRVHRGELQRSSGSIFDVDSQSLYYGAGSRAVGTGTVANPGLRLLYPIGDIILEPRAASQTLVSDSASASGVRNSVLLDVASAYLELLAADLGLKVLRQSEKEFREIERLTGAFAKAGQGRLADANRSIANAELLRRQIIDAEGERTATAARLASFLNLNATGILSPPGELLPPLRFFRDDVEAEVFVQQAFGGRPELIAARADIELAKIRLRQEEVRPWLPTVSVGFSAGSFGGGSNRTPGSFSNFDGRTDFDVIAALSLRNSGVGNRAIQNRARAQLGQAIAVFDEKQNQIRSEVLEAHALVQAGAVRIRNALNQLGVAQEGFEEEMKRIKQTEARPIEVLDSTRQLLESRLELIRTVTDYNIAQFRLLTAVGRPAPELRIPERLVNVRLGVPLPQQ